MRHLDLFSGIGGFALAAQEVWGDQHEIHSFVEIDPFCQKILKKHWPDVPVHGDIRTYEHDGTDIDLLTGGFPCQDLSTAGKCAGISGERSGLWSEIKRLLREVRPRFAVMENVTNLLAGDQGRWFGTVLWDLAEVGYNAEWHCVPASAIGAPHHRDRVWIIAYPRGGGWSRTLIKTLLNGEASPGWETIEHLLPMPVDWREHVHGDATLRTGNGIPHFVDRLRGCGNAIVPQVVIPIMKAIQITALI